MNEELIKSYMKLDTNNKRDKLNRELLVIGELLKKIEWDMGLDNEVDIYNYNVSSDNKMSEDEFLVSTYQDIFNVERELLTISKILKENEKDEMFN